MRLATILSNYPSSLKSINKVCKIFKSFSDKQEVNNIYIIPPNPIQLLLFTQLPLITHRDKQTERSKFYLH